MQLNQIILNFHCRQHAFPGNGLIEYGKDEFRYRFHGAGCSVYHKDLEYLFDYEITSKNYLLISPWKFAQFINGMLSKSGLPLMDVSEVSDKLQELNNEGIIIRRHPEYFDYYVNFLMIEEMRPLGK